MPLLYRRQGGGQMTTCQDHHPHKRSRRTPFEDRSSHRRADSFYVYFFPFLAGLIWVGWGDKKAVGNCFKINIFKKVVALYTLKAGHNLGFSVLMPGWKVFSKEELRVFHWLQIASYKYLTNYLGTNRIRWLVALEWRLTWVFTKITLILNLLLVLYWKCLSLALTSKYIKYNGVFL